MRAQLINLFNELRASYWFIPSLMVVAAALLASITDLLDSNIKPSLLTDVSWLYQTQSTGARAVLSAIATSMLGVAGVTFSMTLVAVSFAAANIGPRVIGNFMRDRGNQITLGTFIATFVYCLLVLRTVASPGAEDGATYVPHISIMVALLLAMLCVANLIYFIHHIPESINVEHLAHQIAQDLQESIDTLFPEDVGDPGSDVRQPAELPALGPSFRVESQPLRAETSGYLQVIDGESLLKTAEQHNLVIRVEYRPGDFIQSDSVLVYANPSARVKKSVAKEITKCFFIGPKRTASQNSMFLVDQLVEIMVRALSPGVNDPQTAVTCIDWLQAAMAKVIERPEPQPYRYGLEGKLRLVIYPESFERIAAEVFEEPLQYIATNRITVMRLMGAIAELIVRCSNQQNANQDTIELLLRHAKAIKEAGDQCLTLDNDKANLSQRYTTTLRIASDPQYGRVLRDSQNWLGGRG